MNLRHVGALVGWFVESCHEMLVKVLALNPSTPKKEVAVGLKRMGVGGVAFNPEVVVDVIELEEVVTESLECRW